MYYPSEAMKVNTFREVRIPTNAEYFARYGYAVSPDSQFSGDEPSPMPVDKLQSMRETESLLLSKAREAELANNNQPSKTE